MRPSRVWPRYPRGRPLWRRRSALADFADRAGAARRRSGERRVPRLYGALKGKTRPARRATARWTRREPRGDRQVALPRVRGPSWGASTSRLGPARRRALRGVSGARARAVLC